MPRPAKPTTHLDQHRHLMGTMPDKEVAKLVNSTAAIVGNYRRKYAIPAYEGYKFGKNQKPPGKKGRGKGGAAAKADGDGAAPRKRRSALDPYLAELGKIPDAEIAEKAGVTVQNVRLFRRKHGITLDESADRRRGGVSKASSAERQDSAVSSIDVALTEDAEPKRGRGRPRKASAGITQGRASSKAGASRGYVLTVRAGKDEREYITLAADIVSAAQEAATLLAAGNLQGEILAIRYLGPGLP